jgi:2-keto-3-deoxy-L-fuconate dehydrogenase
MYEPLRGRTAFITGAAQGIGRASALLMAERGAVVWASDVNERGLRQLPELQPNIRVRRLDVTSPSEIDACFRECGPVDILFNCAGWVHQGDLLNCSDADWEFSFKLNVTSMFHICKAAIPGMRERRRGSIINMASIVSSIKGAPARFAYGASKAAVIGLTKAIAADYVTEGIRCNAICPGTVDTPSLAERMASTGDVVKARTAFIARQPMGRLGTAEDIAHAALYLADDVSSFITGQTLVIDGGWSI